ncbi:hypothetical protein FHR55_002963 [Xanthomonas arboricola]
MRPDKRSLWRSPRNPEEPLSCGARRHSLRATGARALERLRRKRGPGRGAGVGVRVRGEATTRLGGEEADPLQLGSRHRIHDPTEVTHAL